jgi:hypothetical protein
MIANACSQPAKLAGHRRWPSVSHDRIQPTFSVARQLLPSVLPLARPTSCDNVPPSRRHAATCAPSPRPRFQSVWLAIASAQGTDARGKERQRANDAAA